MDLIRQFNRLAGENKSLIQKALTSASGVGEALVPQHLEQVITNALPRLSPTLAMITSKFDNQKYHEFNRLTALPGVGGAMGEGATTPTFQPTFQRTGVYMKVVRRKGSTTDFLQDASKKNIDAAATNIEANLLAHVYDLENYLLYGNAGSNPYEFSGLDTFIQSNRINKTVGGVVPTTLKDLDDLIDMNLDYQGSAHNKAIYMSPYMLSKFSQLLTNVRLTVSNPMTFVEMNGGWRLNAYRDIPIVVSSACRPKTQMGTLTLADVDGGGTIADDTYYFRVSAVTRDGEQLASEEASVVVDSGGDAKITITFTPVVGAYRYKVYAGDTTGVLTLKRIVPAFTYDGNGTISVSDTNTINTNTQVTSNSTGAVNVITILATPLTADSIAIPTGSQSDVPLTGSLTSPPEYIFFWDLDEFQGLGRLAYTNEGGSRFNGLVTIEDLAKTDDYLPFMIKSYCALADSFEKTSSVIRGLKVA
jgi:hypothetical protein